LFFAHGSYSACSWFAEDSLLVRDEGSWRSIASARGCFAAGSFESLLLLAWLLFSPGFQAVCSGSRFTVGSSNFLTLFCYSRFPRDVQLDQVGSCVNRIWLTIVRGWFFFDPHLSWLVSAAPLGGAAGARLTFFAKFNLLQLRGWLMGFASASWLASACSGFAFGSTLPRGWCASGSRLARGRYPCSLLCRFQVPGGESLARASVLNLSKWLVCVWFAIEWFVAGPAWLRGAVIPVGCAAWMVGGWSVAAT
jgi:hypothetical protein